MGIVQAIASAMGLDVGGSHYGSTSMPNFRANNRFLLLIRVLLPAYVGRQPRDTESFMEYHG